MTAAFDSLLSKAIGSPNEPGGDCAGPAVVRPEQGVALVRANGHILVRMQDDDGGSDDESGTGTGLATRTRTKTKKPSLYRVLLLNDDFTPMEFVVHVLERFFGKNRAQATRIMLHVHNHGVGECGIFTFEVAETKVTQVMDFARKHQHPLQCVMEKK